MSKYANPSNSDVRWKIWVKYNAKCSYCGCDIDLDQLVIDHIIPKRRKMQYSELPKGKDEIDNYNPSCYSCNSSKSSFELEAWRNEISKKTF